MLLSQQNWFGIINTDAYTTKGEFLTSLSFSSVLFLVVCGGTGLFDPYMLNSIVILTLLMIKLLVLRRGVFVNKVHKTITMYVPLARN